MKRMPTRSKVLMEMRDKEFHMNELFQQKVRDGLTVDGLRKLIVDNPEKWKCFSHWLEHLPEK